jgi:serine/threonine protein phosphatase PrpC
MSDERSATESSAPAAAAGRLQAWGASDVGRKREQNEDSFLVDLPLGLFIVSDGMGGHAAGEVASATTVDEIHKALAAQRDPFLRLATDTSPAARAEAGRAVEQAILTACREVFRLGQADRRRKGMGCTVDVVAIAGTTAIIGHVGDSRVYLLREGRIHALTEDHTLAAQLVRTGKMTWKDLEGSDLRSILQRAVGVHESVEVDTLVVDLAEGDRLLLCSDGLHGYFEGDPAPATRFGGEVATLAQRLVEFANERGGEDNVTAVVVAVGGETDDRQAALRHEVMGKTPLFENLTTKEQAAILAVGQVQQVAAGTSIVQEGDAGDDLYVVIRGRASVLKDGVAIAELGPGGHFGEMGLVDHTSRSATVRAEEPSAVLHIERPALMAVMRREPTIGVKLLWGLVQTLSERLRATNADIVVLHGKLSGPRREGPF